MIYAEIVAGGKGTRMGNTELPKQFLMLGDKPVLIHTVERFLSSPRIDRIILCVPGEWKAYTSELLDGYTEAGDKIDIVSGGEHRNATVLAGCRYIEEKFGISEEDIILTHDAVRPFVTRRVIDENIEAVEKYGAEHVIALSVSYGQKHDKELRAAKAVAEHYGVEQLFLDLGLIFQYSNCSLLKGSSEEIPEENQANYMFPYMYPVPETYDYTKEDLPCYPTSVGFSSLATVMQDNLQCAIDAGADVRYSTKGVELITDDSGAVTGIYAQADGSEGYIKINAPAVVLTTGDYLGNEDMMKFYAPECVENGIQVLSIDFDAEGNYTNIGDGHKMGVWAGAAIEQWHAPMIHHMGGGAGADGRGVIGNNGFLWLNLRGERFMNEDIPGQQLENQVELQPQRKAYQFFDSSWPEQLKYFPAAHGVACFYQDEPLPDYTASGLRINVRTPEDIDTAVEEGRCLKADTIEELLSQIEGMDVETAKASIERYNELCKAGEDTDFFKSSQRLFALENGPFYAAECGCALTLGNLGGIESDADCHAYNTNRERIPGLYVAGATQGGRFAVQYPISLKGLSAGMCMVYGKLAGENAAALA